MTLANITNWVLSISTVFLQIASLVLIIMIVAKDKGNVAKWFSDNSLKFIALVSGMAMLGSLWYSEVIGYKPCILCWYQRISMYSLAILTLTANIKKYTKEIFKYATVLSIIGFIVAAFHVTERFAKSDLLNCGAVGPSCLQNLFKIFGFIDIPVMSLTVFLFILLVILNRKRFINN